MTSLPDSTTILGAFKVTGRTDGGLSVAVLQAFTQKETASVTSPLGQRDAVVEPFGSYTVGRLHKDWDKGNTSLGGMLTSTHRWVGDSAARLPAHPGHHGRDRLHPSLRQPRVGARGERRREPRDGRPRGDPGPADERGPLLPAARREPPRRGPERHLALRPRRHGALRPLRHQPAAPHRPLPLVLAGARPERRRLPPPGRPDRQPGVPRLVGDDAEGHLPQLLGPARARGPVGLRRPQDALADGARDLRPVQEQVARGGERLATRTWWTRACSGAGPRCAGTTTTRRSSSSAATTRGVPPRTRTAATPGRATTTRGPGARAWA